MIQKLKSLFTKKFLIRFILGIGLVYTLVIGLTMFYLDSFTRHGEQIEVPNLKEKNIKSIAPLMAELNLGYEVLDSIFEPNFAEGTILDQDPKPTEISEVFVKEGRIIRLRVSKRTRLVEMPDLVDKSQRFAESILKNRGLDYRLSFKNTTEANGAILEQNFKGKPIKPGMKLQVGSKVDIVVGRNEGGIPVQVPNLYGLTINEAQNRLAEIGGVGFFPVCFECKSSQDSLTARISSQTPQFYEGAMMPSGGTITVNAVLNFSDTLGL